MKSIRPIILDEFVIVISKLEEVNKNIPFSVFSSSFRTYIIEQKFNMIPFQTLGSFDKRYDIHQTDRIIRLVVNGIKK